MFAGQQLRAGLCLRMILMLFMSWTSMQQLLANFVLSVAARLRRRSDSDSLPDMRVTATRLVASAISRPATRLVPRLATAWPLAIRESEATGGRELASRSSSVGLQIFELLFILPVLKPGVIIHVHDMYVWWHGV